MEHPQCPLAVPDKALAADPQDPKDDDLEMAIALSLEAYTGEPHQYSNSSFSTEPTECTEHDIELQQALALSLQTFEEEQQHYHQASGTSRPANKRPNSDDDIPHAGLEATMAKRQRSDSVHCFVQPVNGISAGAVAPAPLQAEPNLLLALLWAASAAPGQVQQQQGLPQLQQQQQRQPLATGKITLQQAASRQQPVAADCSTVVVVSPAAGCESTMGLGRSGSVQDCACLAKMDSQGMTAGLDDGSVHDRGEVSEGVASDVSGGSVAGGSVADRGEYDAVVDQGKWHQPQHLLLQAQAQQPQALGQQPQVRQLQAQPQVLQPPQQQQVLAGSGSKPAEVGARRMYYEREPVWWLNPVLGFCYRGEVVTSVSAAADKQASAALRRYIVDIQGFAVRYVEAMSQQLLPRLVAGDRVWCKPSLALDKCFSIKPKQPQLLQQPQAHKAPNVQPAHTQQQQQPNASAVGASGDQWYRAGWVLGQVKQAWISACCPVVEVALPDGSACWFPVVHVDKAWEKGESSSAAAARGAPQGAAVVQANSFGSHAQQQHEQPQQEPSCEAAANTAIGSRPAVAEGDTTMREADNIGVTAAAQQTTAADDNNPQQPAPAVIEETTDCAQLLLLRSAGGSGVDRAQQQADGVPVQLLPALASEVVVGQAGS